MEVRKEKEPIPQKKYALIACLKGEDRYVLADENGDLKSCNEEGINQLRYEESLISFSSLEETLRTRAKAREGLHLLPPGSAESYVNKTIREIIIGAAVFLGNPPRDKINFFTVPDKILDKFDWVFKGPSRS